MGGKKQKKANIRSTRGTRRSEKIETTGHVLRIIGILLMIAFYIIMIYTVFNYRIQIDALLGQFNATSTGGFIFLPFYGNQIIINGVV